MPRAPATWHGRRPVALVACVAALAAEAAALGLQDDIPPAARPSEAKVSQVSKDMNAPSHHILPMKPRVFFFAGVEGAGHEVFEALWRNEYQAERILRLPVQWGCGEEWAADGVQTLTATFSALERRRTLWALPPNLPYPGCAQSDHAARKNKTHPRLDYIMAAAMAAQVELHVIVLNRDLEDALSADCLFRGLESCALQAETLNKNAEVLAAQLDMRGRAGDAADIHMNCWEYPGPLHLETMIRQFLGFRPEADELVRRVFQEHVPHRFRSKLLSMVPDFALASGNGAIAAACKNVSRVSLDIFRNLLASVYT